MDEVLKQDSYSVSKNIGAEKINASGSSEKIQDRIPFETLLSIELNESKRLTLSCSPQDLLQLTVGYLVNHGYVEDYSDIGFIKLCDRAKSEDGLLQKVVVSARTTPRAEESQNIKFLSSACGDIDDLILSASLKKNPSKKKFSRMLVLGLNRQTLESQDHKKRCGGLHSAALFDEKGRLLYAAEDIGRHNCIDKTAGFILMNKIDPLDKVLFTTGRISLDIIYKVSAMGIPVIVSNSSVTYGAAEAAGKTNITVIGYARGHRFNIYSCPGRIIQ